MRTENILSKGNSFRITQVLNKKDINYSKNEIQICASYLSEPSLIVIFFTKS
jgi:hypothetical protein